MPHILPSALGSINDMANHGDYTVWLQNICSMYQDAAVLLTSIAEGLPMSMLPSAGPCPSDGDKDFSSVSDAAMPGLDVSDALFAHRPAASKYTLQLLPTNNVATDSPMPCSAAETHHSQSLQSQKASSLRGKWSQAWSEAWRCSLLLHLRMSQTFAPQKHAQTESRT